MLNLFRTFSAPLIIKFHHYLALWASPHQLHLFFLYLSFFDRINLKVCFWLPDLDLRNIRLTLTFFINLHTPTIFLFNRLIIPFHSILDLFQTFKPHILVYLLIFLVKTILCVALSIQACLDVQSLYSNAALVTVKQKYVMSFVLLFYLLKCYVVWFLKPLNNLCWLLRLSLHLNLTSYLHLF